MSLTTNQVIAVLKCRWQLTQYTSPLAADIIVSNIHNIILINVNGKKLVISNFSSLKHVWNNHGEQYGGLRHYMKIGRSLAQSPGHLARFREQILLQGSLWYSGWNSNNKKHICYHFWGKLSLLPGDQSHLWSYQVTNKNSILNTSCIFWATCIRLAQQFHPYLTCTNRSSCSRTLGVLQVW